MYCLILCPEPKSDLLAQLSLTMYEYRQSSYQHTQLRHDLCCLPLPACPFLEPIPHTPSSGMTHVENCLSTEGYSDMGGTSLLNILKDFV